MALQSSNTEFVDIQGKISWLYAVGLNKFDAWSVTIHPNPESLEKVRELQAEGVKNNMKKNDEGYYIAFKREPQKKISGKIVAFAAPQVVGVDGAPVDPTRVGNGSDATVRLEVYKHKTPTGGTAKAARFHSIRIDNLVPYNTSSDFPSDGERDNAQSLKDSKEHVF